MYAIPDGEARAARKAEVTGAAGFETFIALIPGAGFLFAIKICPVGEPPNSDRSIAYKRCTSSCLNLADKYW